MPLLFLASLVLAVAAWLWGPPLWARWRRARVVRQPFPPAWREILRQRMPYFRRLPPDLQLQLKKHIQILVAEKPFIGCNGLQITDEVRVLVAAQVVGIDTRPGQPGRLAGVQLVDSDGNTLALPVDAVLVQLGAGTLADGTIQDDLKHHVPRLITDLTVLPDGRPADGRQPVRWPADGRDDTAEE